MLGMPVLADTALGLSTLSCHALRVLYEGPAASEDEILCKDLMESRLLQRYRFFLDICNARFTLYCSFLEIRFAYFVKII